MTDETAATTPALPPGAARFDFWLGHRDVRWSDGLSGTNHVRKVLGDRVVHEDFDGERDAQLRGLSVSVSGMDGRWRQTWVDDNGAYLHPWAPGRTSRAIRPSPALGWCSSTRV